MSNENHVFLDFFDRMCDNWLKNQLVNEGDWFDGEILYCGKCRQPRRTYRDIGGKTRLTTEMCACEIAKVDEEKRREAEKQRMERSSELRKYSLMDAKFRASTFDTFEETPYNARALKLAKSYCDRFPEMVKKNQGLLFYGGVGTGKTHLTACIANRLLDDCYSVIMTSFTKVLKNLSPFGGTEEEKYIKRLCDVTLCIIDDLGVESGTETTLSKLYDIIDSRYRSGKPTIFTTNIPFEQMQNCTDIKYIRIYDRIFEMCYPIQMGGPSWRKKTAAQRFEEMKILLEE